MDLKQYKYDIENIIKHTDFSHKSTVMNIFLKSFPHKKDEITQAFFDSEMNNNENLNFNLIKTILNNNENNHLDVNKANINGDFPIHVACKLKSHKLLHLLIAIESTKINAVNNENQTALNICQQNQWEEGIKLISTKNEREKC